MVAFRLGLWIASGWLAFSLSAAEYEITGTIDHEITRGGDSAGPGSVVSAEFTVYVRDCSWLIHTEEYDLVGSDIWSTDPVVREIGTNNGNEILEVISPRSVGRQGTPNRRVNLGTIVSNSVPVGRLDNSVVGHLWPMFASGCYLSGLTNNLLTPVYDATASDPGNPNLRFEASWELADGPGSLPLEVVYKNGTFNRTDASYRALRVWHVGGMTFPAGFVFEKYISGERVWKRATATVTSIRPVCSLESLLPAITLPTGVADRRLNQSEDPVSSFTYQLNPGTTELPPVEAAKRAYDLRRNPPEADEPWFLGPAMEVPE